APISVSFSEPVDPATILFAVADSSGRSTSGVVTYNPSTNSATFTPTTSYATSTLYTVTISGAMDAFGNILAPVTWTFTTTPFTTIWSTMVPAIPAVNDPSPIEVGVKFDTDVTGQITGVRFYKGTGNTGTHVGHLWTGTGTLLATVTFTNETASGWQQA